MQVADTNTVLGDFSGARLRHDGEETEFHRRDDKFWISTIQEDGTQAEFEVKYTFGVHPLQQYLLEASNGGYQAFPIAWDARSADAGGQRWFDLYPDEEITAADPLHWTGRLQSWNTMCADCHSTDLEKAYTVETDRFDTKWASIDVSCEACHGPGSLHTRDPSLRALALGAVSRAWVQLDASGIARRTPESANSTETETCARCHSRRSQLSEHFSPGESFLDHYRPTLLEPGLYHADGQILDEVYVYGSFLQSAMHRAGVTCSDCHDPHSGALRATGNDLCSQCHAPTRFDTQAHHRHAPNSAGSECVACHMSSRLYMVVDERRDHSFRVPRPDLSISFGTPNACTQCHADQSNGWAADATLDWFPQGRSGRTHYGQAIHAATSWSTDRSQQLRTLALDQSAPAIARATALQMMASQLDDEILNVVAQGLSDPEPLVQLGALVAARAAPAAFVLRFAQDLLAHPLRAIRSETAQLLAPLADDLEDPWRPRFEAALEEYRETQLLNSDRAEGQYNLARTYVDLGQIEPAIAAFRAAILREPGFVPAFVNMANLYQQTGDEAAASEILERAVTEGPENPAALLALGLSLVREGQRPEALAMIERAARSGAGDPYYRYVWGIAVHSTGDRERALEILRSAYDRFPGYRLIVVALATIHRDGGDTQQALEYARALFQLSPTDPSARGLLSELGEPPPP
jgi:predicted CXXCH cytochrome family protein